MMEKQYRYKVEAQIMDQETWNKHSNFINVTAKKDPEPKAANLPADQIEKKSLKKEQEEQMKGVENGRSIHQQKLDLIIQKSKE